MDGQFQPQSVFWKVSADLLGVNDATGRFRHTNPAWRTVLGWSAEEVEAFRYEDLLHPDDVDRTNEAFAALLDGRPVMLFENRYRHKDGSYRWLSWNAVPEGDVFICSARDVTQSKADAASLRTREEEARLREQFVAVLGHDLRNPLTAVSAAMRLLSREVQSERGTELIRMTTEAADRMAALIGDVLDLARTRLGEGIELARQEVADLEAVIDKVVDETALSYPGITIERSYDLGGPYLCDPGRLGQLVSNLVSNAVTHGGTDRPIRIEARDDGTDLHLSVANEGEAIPEDKLPLLFEPFARGDGRASQNGLGLGLFIARQIARGHGGELTVASDDDRTVFALRMPARHPS
ncbi:PAS domain S-box-containing protein [Hasllibacter halocynthiae]|uniref:histidine kinase n=1 Tax=Hasllibacter halocynthiae TaxID=595589 RepID=A0A2T0X844_9RHOB|nr:PAS domain-containing sensor histidine kinase [Hasllibacter halocynthiae]PRY95122.1 PAS domain S-box-containing protein [Hasllibacter halocynthiae]